jgi:hypothetical protein
MEVAEAVGAVAVPGDAASEDGVRSSVEAGFGRPDVDPAAPGAPEVLLPEPG